VKDSISSWSWPRENKAIDAVTLEVIWNRFLSVANEQQDALIRTAFSTIVRESQDLACGMFDTKGRMIAQSLSGTPGHINAMATSMKHFLAAFPPHTLAPGDVLITNDPWQTAGQINDITITTPIFRGGKMVALFANTCRSADIGGRILSAEAREVFEEGLRIPIMKLFDGGEPNKILLQIVRTNVRQPDEGIGDFYAQTACNDAGGRARSRCGRTAPCSGRLTDVGAGPWSGPRSPFLPPARPGAKSCRGAFEGAWSTRRGLR